MDKPTNKNKSRRPRQRRKPGSGQAHGQGRGKPGGAQRGRPQQNKAAGPRSAPKGQLPPRLVYGINAVGVAIETGQLKTLFYDKSRQSERLQHIHAHAQAEHIDIQPMQRQGWSKILPTEMHQGVAGMLLEQPAYYLEEIVHDVKEDSCILVLDRIQDPQNLGAVLRTAAATGVDAVVLPKTGGCTVTPAVHKASAGMSLVMKVVEDENLSRAIDFLKDNGYWVIGCDSAGGENATTFEYPHKRVIVMGNEAEGMRQMIRESCDYLVKIPMDEGVESLNISVATGIVLYLARADLARAEIEAAHEAANGNGEAAEAPAEGAPEQNGEVVSEGE